MLSSNSLAKAIFDIVNLVSTRAGLNSNNNLTVTDVQQAIERLRLVFNVIPKLKKINSSITFSIRYRQYPETRILEAQSNLLLTVCFEIDFHLLFLGLQI